MKLTDLIPQNDPRLYEKVRKLGCNFRSLLCGAEVFCDKALTAGQINDAYDFAVGVPSVMNENCRMDKNLRFVVDWACAALGKRTARCRQVGIAYPGSRFEFWPSTNAFTVLKGLLHEAGYEGRDDPTFHFRYGNRQGRMTWDPFPGSVILEEDSTLIYFIDA